MSEQSAELDFSARYRHSDFRGVALRIHGWVKTWEPYTGLTTDEDGTEFEEEIPGEGEWVDDVAGGRVLVIMVGDDRKYTVDLEDLEPIEDHEYCHECGQIGCGHGAPPPDEEE